MSGGRPPIYILDFPSPFGMLDSVTPSFIVDDLAATLELYQSRLWFDILHKGGDGHGNDAWAMVGRDRVMIMFEHIAPAVHPQPNRSRHECASWDAYIFTSDPAAGNPAGHKKRGPAPRIDPDSY